MIAAQIYYTARTESNKKLKTIKSVEVTWKSFVNRESIKDKKNNRKLK